MHLQEDAPRSPFLSICVTQCEGSMGGFDGPRRETGPATALSQVSVILGEISSESQCD